MKYENLIFEINQSDLGLGRFDNFLEQYSGPRNVALDLGAHVGTRSLWLATDGGFERVWAVEANAANFLMLVHNITTNSLKDRVTPILATVDAGQYLCDMMHGIDNQGQYSIHYSVEGKVLESFYKTASIALSTLIALIGKVDFIKCDIEGSEYPLFADADVTAKTLEGVCGIMVETHAPNDKYFSPKWLASLGYDPEDPNKLLIDHIKKCGFENIIITEIGQIIALRSKENAL